MKLKRLLFLVLLVALVLSFASCNLGKKHTVRFDSDGGTDVATQSVKNGKCAVEPAAPIKVGYTFAGWYNGDSQWDFSTPVTEDVTLVAKWTADVTSCAHEDSNKDGSCDLCNASLKFKVVYKDGTKTMSFMSKYTSYSVLDTAFELPVAKKTHFEFLGWYTDNAFTEPITEVTRDTAANLTLYARWGKQPFTVTYLDHLGNMRADHDLLQLGAVAESIIFNGGAVVA